MTSVGEIGLQLEMALTELDRAISLAEEATESAAQARDLCLKTFEGSGNQTALECITEAQHWCTQAYNTRAGLMDLWYKLRTVRKEI